jgi:cell division protein FtsB
VSPSRPAASRRPSTGRPGSGASAGRPKGSASRRPAATAPGRAGARAGGGRTGGAQPPPPIGPAPPAERGGRPSGRIAVIALVLLVLVISYASTLRAWLAQRDEIDAARAELVATRERVAQLSEDEERWKDPAFARAEARERLGWVLPGEVHYQVLGDDGRPIGNDVSLDDPPAKAEPPPTDWYSTVWGSVQAAGSGPERQ